MLRKNINFDTLPALCRRAGLDYASTKRELEKSLIVPESIASKLESVMVSETTYTISTNEAFNRFRTVCLSLLRHDGDVSAAVESKIVEEFQALRKRL